MISGCIQMEEQCCYRKIAYMKGTSQDVKRLNKKVGFTVYIFGFNDNYHVF